MDSNITCSHKVSTVRRFCHGMRATFGGTSSRTDVGFSNIKYDFRTDGLGPVGVVWGGKRLL